MSEPPTSEFFYILLVLFYTDRLVDALELHVYSSAFEYTPRGLARAPSDESDSDYSSDHSSLWEKDSSSSSLVSSFESSR
jgi:hypothetical protein